MTIRPVLIIEDDDDGRQMLEDFFDASGFRTVSAKSGDAGLALLRDSRPFVVVLDCWTPHMTGAHFRFEQRRLADGTFANVPIILVTADLNWRQHAEALDGVDVLPKPIDLDRLLALVSTYAAAL